MIDVERLLAGVDLVQLVEHYLRLKPIGHEWKGLCPFHEERTPSFHVVPSKGFVHCFGCGAHHNAIGFLMHVANVPFVEACERLGAARLPDARAVAKRSVDVPTPSGLWIPISPVPDYAATFASGLDGAIWNPKRGRWWKVRPDRADEYRNALGQLMGYVLRLTFSDGEKVTPQVTWCIGPDGSERWCTVPFPKPRPLCGLDVLAARPDAPVLIVEGEKCRAAGAGALPGYAVICWPGGTKGIRFVDWSPLAGRTIVLWPDADQVGRDAMLGYEKSSGMIVRGVAQYANAAGCLSIRMVDPVDQPKGWDLADSLAEGWTAKQIGAWAARRVVDIDVLVDGTRRAA